MTQPPVLTGQDIAEAFGAVQGLQARTLAGAGELLAGLEARGLATGTAKDGPGPAQLTPQGTQTLRRLNETIAPAVRELYSGIAAEDLATAHRVLRQVIDRAGQLGGEPANG